MDSGRHPQGGHFYLMYGREPTKRNATVFNLIGKPIILMAILNLDLRPEKYELPYQKGLEFWIRRHTIE